MRAFIRNILLLDGEHDAPLKGIDWLVMSPFLFVVVLFLSHVLLGVPS